MPKAKCDTPKCKGRVVADNRFCLACHRKLQRLMRESGYLQDLTWVHQEERRRARAMMGGTGQSNANRQSRIHGDVVVARQVTGEMLGVACRKGKK